VLKLAYHILAKRLVAIVELVFFLAQYAFPLHVEAESSVCWAGMCEPPKCDDGILNGDETEWDCGGSCEPCP
jgi:hypothetical protein